jgi:hypothetical protein
MTVVPDTSYSLDWPPLRFFCFPDQDTVHFDTTEVIEAVLNTLIDTLSRTHFKNWKKRWERRILAEWDYFEGNGGQYAQS